MTARTILITGATSGIGRALALAYAGPQTALRLVGRDAGRMDEIAGLCRAAGAGVATALVDVRDRDGLGRRILAWDGEQPIDLVVAGAGITSGLGVGRALETPEAVRAVLAVDLVGVINTVEPLLAPMLARRSGHVAVIGSLGALRGLPSSPAYSAAKAAVHAYAEGIRPRLRRQGIAVSIVAPGFVATPLNRDIVAPRPLQVSAERAAAIIRRGLDRRKAMIAFPLPLYIGLRLLGCLPHRLGDGILDRPGIEVPETAERGSTIHDV
ncbi:SDR family NAD(P)-dependent oxidoreductase [Labrys wisconsinensis]|uniref:Short-subunit dehydrogenase n=1 Tax=Labrys wisconsinensis TaxID=425677 RepID=A0ABU0IZ18_9HYPH|nr:SDR family NAD(P)-dependent oxidoreductase [Labrys wisconsinensis]MDQ0467259.1 short-subunit dehydrogenase [Labrys wisconsinensis]